MSPGMLHVALRELSSYVKNSGEIEQIIIHHSLAAAAAATASGWIPGAGGTIATVIALGFTLSMYIRICSHCGIKLKKNILKTVASVAIAEIVAYISVILVAETALTFIPGLGNVSAALISGIVNFAIVYIAGLLFLKLMVSVFKAKKDINDLSEEELKQAMKQEADKSTIKNAYKEAKNSYKNNKDNDAYNIDDIKPTE